MRVSLYFRKPTASFFSIENLFATVISHFKHTLPQKVELPYKSAINPLALLKNSLFAKDSQGQVNHITGDVYYIAMALDGKKTILTIHDLDSLYSNNKIKNSLLQLFWLQLPVKKAMFITVISEHSKKKLRAATGIAEDKVVVVPNCVPFTNEDFKPKNSIDKTEPILLQVGTKSNKNLENVLAAIEGFACKLIIIGRLSDSDLAQLHDKGITYENHVQLSYEAVIKLYYKADIVTFVSTYEGFGMPILEANALGRPVITSNVSAMPEVAGEGALLVNPYEPKEIRAAIEKLVADDVSRNKLVEAGYKNVQRFRPEQVAAQYEALYKRVIEENK